MSVRVVARIRPLLGSEAESHVIVKTGAGTGGEQNTVTVPNPKNAAENYTFCFNSVYDHQTCQQQIFEGEIAPTVKHLFAGFDVTIFAYGVTGTGKTHTMRGGKSLADRGVIPRLLSNIYRKGRKIEKDNDGEGQVVVTLSYYEIYNDKVFDLFEPIERRTMSGLAIRDNNGKTVVCGLSERPCSTLKEFEQLYDQANINRSTSATKVSHAAQSDNSSMRIRLDRMPFFGKGLAGVKLTQTTGNEVRVATVSAIDLAGSEDNRRTDNNKERLVESSAINKSLFVLAQCVEAISKGQARIPYRESKMTRILSLGQNQGLTIMVLNLAPVRAYHLDTLSSLNFANRTKKIEIREVENEPIFAGKIKGKPVMSENLIRAPLRPIQPASNLGLTTLTTKSMPQKSFAVFAEQQSAHGRKRSFEGTTIARPSKIQRPNLATRPSDSVTTAKLEEMINKLVDDRLAKQASAVIEKPTPTVSEQLQKRLEALEERVERKEDGGRAEGLQYLLMAKQHALHGEDSSALRMYQLAMPFFPDNQRLADKMLSTQERISQKRAARQAQASNASTVANVVDPDNEYVDDGQHSEDESFVRSRPKKSRTGARLRVMHDPTDIPHDVSMTPRSESLLKIINTRDLTQIRLLRGVGLKKAEAIVNSLCEMEEGAEGVVITNLTQLGSLRGVGLKTVENMRSGIAV